MDLRPKGPLPAMAALFLSMVLVFVALLVVSQANSLSFPERPEPDAGELALGGGAFVLSIVAGGVAVALWGFQERQQTLMPTSEVGAVAPALALAGAARDFVGRLHRTMLAVGAMVLLGGLGLMGSAATYANIGNYQTFRGPFGIPGKVWVIPLDSWVAQVTVWCLVLLAIALAIWSTEYRWTRRLRAAWDEAAPEV